MTQKIILSAVLFLNVVFAHAQCAWLDGQDPRYPFDPGRGVTRWSDHNGYALSTRDLNSCAAFVGDRMLTLTKCLNVDAYGKLYADVSVKIAEYGISNTGWRNGPNNVLPNDGGCGILDWNAHYNYIKVNGYYNAAELVKNRMIYLLTIQRESYSRMYADVSVIIARYGLGAPYPTGNINQTTTSTTTQTAPANVNINMNIGGVGMNMNVNDANYQQQTVVQQTTTTTSSSGYQGDPVYVQQGGLCSLAENDFSQIESSIKSKPFPDTKMSTAQLALKGRCLSINQIRGLTKLFDFPEDRLNFLKYAYDFTNDGANYYTLSNTLNFDSDVENFNSFLSGKR